MHCTKGSVPSDAIRNSSISYVGNGLFVITWSRVSVVNRFDMVSSRFRNDLDLNIHWL